MTTLAATMAPAAAGAPSIPLPEYAPRPAGIPRSRVVLPALAILFLAAMHTYEISIPGAILYPVGGLVLLALILNSLRDPSVALLALAAYIPFSRVFPGNFEGAVTALNLTNILTAVGLVAWFGAARWRGGPLVPRASLNLPVVLFALLSLIAFVRGGMEMGTWYFEGVIYNFKRWLDPFIVYFLFLGLIRRKETMRNLIIVLLMAVLAASLMGFVEHFDRVERYFADGDMQRIQGISEQPNQLGAFFVYYGALFLGLAAVRPWSSRYGVLLVPFLLSFRAAQYTGSRGALLGLVAAVLSLCFLRNKVLFLGLALLIAAAVSNPHLLPEGTQAMVGRTFVNEGEDLQETLDKSAANRIALWGAAMEVIQQEPLWGVGYGLFGQIIPVLLPDMGARDVHNTYLLIAAEMGIPALIVFLWILGAVFWETLRLYWDTQDRFFRGVALGFAAGLGGLVVVCVFGSRITSFEIFGYFWILAAIVVRANALERAERAARAVAPLPPVPWVAGTPART
jgi:O-antigen ligase